MEALKLTTEALVSQGQDRTYVVVENADRPDEYVQLQLHDNIVYAEVGSRQWAEPFVPLSDDAIIALGQMGFTGGGPKQNYVRDGLPRDPGELALLVEKLFQAAYGRGAGLSVVVSTNSADVHGVLKDHGCWVGRLMSDELTKVEPLNLDAVERLLGRRGCTVFRQQDTGRLMTFWGWDDELGSGVNLYFSAESDGAILRISGVNDRPLRGKRRSAEVLRAINEWNGNQRWPKAYLLPVEKDGKAYGWVETSLDIPVGAGVHRAMVEDLVDTAVGATLHFYRYMNERIDWSTVAAKKP